MDKNTRICIIGAGPAGLAAAYYLEKEGYFNYTIYERQNRVGGKCWSLEYKGRKYEMGAAMAAATCNTLHEIEEYCGIQHDGPRMRAKFRSSDGKIIRPWKPEHNLSKAIRLIRIKIQLKKFAHILETKYFGYSLNGHRGLSEGKYDGFMTNGEHIAGVNDSLKDLALPFTEFLRINHVKMLRDVWLCPVTSFGYGYFDEIPAAYVLKGLDFHTCELFLKNELWTWKDGTQSIWIALNAKLANPAILDAVISSVKRESGVVSVTVNGKVETFDKVIVTSPLYVGHARDDGLVGLVDYFDVRNDELEQFSKIDYERYDVLACEIKSEKPRVSWFIPDNMTPDRKGHLMVCYERWQDTNDQVLTTYALRSHKDSIEIPREISKQWVLEDLRTIESPAYKVLNEQSFYYFPHVFSEDYAAGWYERVEDMQGKYNTYYAGEIMSFGDMEETIRYSKELIARFFHE